MNSSRSDVEPDEHSSLQTRSSGHAGRNARRKWGFRLAVLFASCLVALTLLEVSVRGLVALGRMPKLAPHRVDSFWDADHPVFGVWHQPQAAAVQSSDCFTTTYETNSVGARDVERSPASAGPRVFVMGDSFVEGWGVAAKDRFSNRLEATTGVEHLNFGMSHFGPYQEYLAYQEFAPQFEHSAVIVGILPVNDFVDLDFQQAQRARSYDYRYRPYLVPGEHGFQHVDYCESAVHRFLRRYSYAYHAIALVLAQARDPEGDDVYAPPVNNNQGLPHSYFFDFSQEQFDLLKECLERIESTAGNRPIAVVLLPSQWDFVRFEKQPEPTLLASRLEAWAEQRKILVVDLLPPMAKANAIWQRYFFDCDYHWNPEGNRVAAEILQRRLTPFLYEKPI